MTRYPSRIRYSATPFEGLVGLLDNPTTAMVWVDFRISGMVAIFDLENFLKLRDLSRCERTISPRRDVQFQKCNLDAPELLHQFAEMLEHDSDLVLPAFGDLHFIPGIAARLDLLQF